MGKMKTELVNEYNKVCKKISNGMDGEYDTYVVKEVENIYNDLEDTMADLSKRFAILDMIMDDFDDVYEKASLQYKDFSDMYQYLRCILK